MRPEDILVPTPAGVCCKLGGFHIDPTRPVERALITHAHSDHARAGHGAVLATQETLDLMRLRYGENFAGSTQAAAYGESIALGGAKVTFHPAGHVLGSAQIAVEADWPARRRLRRLQERRRSDLRAVRAGAVRRVHHRGDVRAAGVPPRRSRRRDRKAHSLRRAVSRARAPGRRLFARQGAARDRAVAPSRLRRTDLSARRDGKDHALLRKPRHRARRFAAGQRRHQAKPRRHHHHLPAVGLERSVDAPLPRSARRLRLGLDAGARAGAPAGRLAAAGHLRPRRLGRPHRDHRRHRRGRNLGHPRPRRRAGALVRHARAESAAARHRRLWRRGRGPPSEPPARGRE